MSYRGSSHTGLPGRGRPCGSAGAAPVVPQAALPERREGEVADRVDARTGRERVAEQGVQALDARGHAAGGDAVDLPQRAELGAPGEVVLVGARVGGGEGGVRAQPGVEVLKKFGVILNKIDKTVETLLKSKLNSDIDILGTIEYSPDITMLNLEGNSLKPISIDKFDEIINFIDSW